MRFFRIPSFTGIEAHRDDADRGSLRMVEGCLPHGPGGLRSGPVWKKIGDVQSYSNSDSNYVTAADDGQGNSLLFVSRNCKVHDLAVISEENTDISNFGETYNVAIPEGSLYSAEDANLTPIGNKLYAVGDGSQESMFVGKGPDDTFEVFPDENLYSQEWSRFPKCRFFVQGPKKTIFASGNPDKPLTVYISEPAGLTSPYRDTPYSTEDTTYNQGILSTVDILGSNASKITALSTRGDQVVVHTDKGCHILYAPAPDQANTGYRVEQAPATNFSAAVSSRVVSRASGALTYWIGHDGQVYKDEAASRGSEDLRSRADEDQANWKSKGVWEHEHPTDLSNSFAAYSPQSGDYLFFIESEEFNKFTKIDAPKNLELRMDNVAWRCDPHFCTATNETKNCCGLISYEGSPPADAYPTLAECVTASGCEVCCESVGISDCCYCGHGPWLVNEDCECFDSGNPCGSGHSTKAECEAHLASLPEGDRCNRYTRDPNSCACYKSPGGIFESLAACEEDRDADQNCGSRYTISEVSDCLCVEDPEGAFYDKYECRKAAIAADPTCSDYKLNDCECISQVLGNGDYEGLAKCQEALVLNPACQGFEAIDCECVYTGLGSATLLDCQAAINSDPNCEEPELVYSYNLNEGTCSCDAVLGTGGTYSTSLDCYEALDALSGCENTYNINDCKCEKDPNGRGVFKTYSSCINALSKRCPGTQTFYISNCTCQSDFTGNSPYSSLEDCVNAVNEKQECKNFLLDGCECNASSAGTMSLYECTEAIPAGCYDKFLPPCCDGNSLLGYETVEECHADPQTPLVNYYCSEEGGSNSYEECDENIDLSDYVSDCSDTGGDEPCTACPDWYWDIVDCECLGDFRSGQGSGYTSEEACQAAVNNTPSCDTFDITDCQCVKNLARTGVYADITSCQTQLDITCPKHSIVNCQCVEDSSGIYQGLADCEVALNTDSVCAPHWIVDCQCTTTDPGDGSGSYPDMTACDDALMLMSECNCDNSDRRYNLLQDGADNFCLDAGSGSGQFTECECNELGYTIT